MKKNLQLLPFFFIVAVCIYYFSQTDKMRENAKYTIGYTQGTHWTLKSGRQVDYRFFVDGHVYKGGDDEKPNVQPENGRYLVKYDSLNPKWNTVYFQVSIPDTIQEAPAQGWSVPPFEVLKEVLKH